MKENNKKLNQELEKKLIELEKRIKLLENNVNNIFEWINRNDN